MLDVAFYTPTAGAVLRPGGSRVAPGGADVQTTLLARALARRGLRVGQVVTADPDLPAMVDGVAVLQREPSRVGARAGAVREALAIWRALHRSGARTVVQQGAGPDVAVVAAYCRAAGRRFVFNSASTLDFTGEFLGRGTRDWRAFRGGLALAHTVVAQSEVQRALADGLVRADRVEVIRNMGSPGEPAETRGEFFLWAARAVDYKGPWEYLELARAVPEARFRMIAGPSDDPAHGVPVGDLAAACSEIDNVEWIEPLSHPELMQTMRRSVAVVNTSPAEGMPMQFLEAWGQGVPVLSLDVDPDDLIDRHDLGRAAGGSWERFTAAARDLWAAREDRSPTTAGIRQRGAALFDPGVVTDAWARVLA